MGWMHRNTENLKHHISSRESPKDIPTTTFIENANTPEAYEPVPTTTSRENLHFIDPTVVSLSASTDKIWLVIDDMVYDCTEFAEDHPGGTDVLQPFRGTDCSWQFWRFHGKNEMEQYGLPLRIGVTKGARNKFQERPRFIGLRKFWSPDDE